MGFFDGFKSIFQTEQPKEENTSIRIPRASITRVSTKHRRATKTNRSTAI